MAEAMGGLRGRLLLSISDVQVIRKTSAGFELEEVETTHTIAGTGAQTGRKELIISGQI